VAAEALRELPHREVFALRIERALPGLCLLKMSAASGYSISSRGPDSEYLQMSYPTKHASNAAGHRASYPLHYNQVITRCPYLLRFAKVSAQGTGRHCGALPSSHKLSFRESSFGGI
jgi:hypothetical protein